MSLFDRALNAAGDAARNSAANHNRTQRRRALVDQITSQQQAISWSMARIGRLALDAAAAAGQPLPEAVEPAAGYVRNAEEQVRSIESQLLAVNARLAAPPAYYTQPQR